jgi:hypothetical protein
MTTDNLESILDRVARLERQNRRLRIVAWATFVLTLALTANLVWAGLRLGRHADLIADKIETNKVETKYVAVVSDDGKDKATMEPRTLMFLDEKGMQGVVLQRWPEGGQLALFAPDSTQMLGRLAAGKQSAKEPFRANLALGPYSGMRVTDDETLLILMPRSRREDKRPGFQEGAAAQLRMTAGLDYVNLGCFTDCTGPVLGGARFTFAADGKKTSFAVADEKGVPLLTKP